MDEKNFYQLVGKAYCDGMAEGMTKSAADSDLGTVLKENLPLLLAGPALSSVGNAAKGGLLGALVGGLSGHGVMHGAEIGSRMGGLGTLLGGGGAALGSLLGANIGGIPGMGLGGILGGGIGGLGGLFAGYKLPTLTKSKKKSSNS